MTITEKGGISMMGLAILFGVLAVGGGHPVPEELQTAILLCFGVGMLIFIPDWRKRE